MLGLYVIAIKIVLTTYNTKSRRILMRLFPCEKITRRVMFIVKYVMFTVKGGGGRSSVSFVLQSSCKTDLKSLFEVEIFKLSVSSKFLQFVYQGHPSLT